MKLRDRSVVGVLGVTVASTGLLVWASCFTLLYAGLSVGCLAGVQHTSLLGVNALSLGLAAVAAVHLAALVFFLRWLQRRPAERSTALGESTFLHRLARVVAATGLAAILVTAVPVLMLPPCESHTAPTQ